MGLSRAPAAIREDADGVAYAFRVVPTWAIGSATVRRTARHDEHTADGTPSGHADVTQAWRRMASISSSIWTFLPTRSPPVSRTTFQLAPKLSRSISVRAEKPARVPPHGSALDPRYPTSSTTGRVTPRMVRSPSTWNVPSSPTAVTEVLVKVRAGKALTSRQ